MARTIYYKGDGTAGDLLASSGGNYTQWFSDVTLLLPIAVADPAPGTTADTIVVGVGQTLDLSAAQLAFEAARNTDPGVANVRAAEQWKFKSADNNRTGTMPVAENGAVLKVGR